MDVCIVTQMTGVGEVACKWEQYSKLAPNKILFFHAKFVYMHTNSTLLICQHTVGAQ